MSVKLSGVPELAVRRRADEIVVRVVPQAEHEHGVDVDHERLAGPELASGGRRAGAAGEPRPVARGDLVAAGERPFPLAPGLAHGQGGQAGDLRLGQALPAAAAQGLEDGPVSDVDDPRGLAEAGDRPGVFDEREPVDEIVGIDELAAGEGIAEALELVVGQVAFGEVVGHPALDPDPAFPALEQVLEEIGDELDLVLAAHRGEPENPVLSDPGLVRDAGGVDDESESGRQALGRDNDEAPPGTKRADGPR